MSAFAVSDKLKKNYENYYDGESEWRRLCSIGKVNNIVSLCGKYPHQNILEIGSGEGAVLQELSDRNFGDCLYSIEISKTAIEAIKTRNIRSLIECKHYDGYTIPYEDKKFDLAILTHVVEHLEYPRRLIDEASRVAKYLFVEVPVEDNLRLKKDYVFDKVGHINYYSPKTIRRLLQTCELRILSQEVANFSFDCFKYMFGKKAIIRYLGKELILRTMPGIAPRLWTYNCSLLCECPQARHHADMTY